MKIIRSWWRAWRTRKLNWSNFEGDIGTWSGGRNVTVPQKTRENLSEYAQRMAWYGPCESCGRARAIRLVPHHRGGQMSQLYCPDCGEVAV